MTMIRALHKIRNGGGLTLKGFEPIEYKSGWQVATDGVTANTIGRAIDAIRRYEGNCGVWVHEGVWYIDKSFRVNTKHEAMDIGRKHNQLSVFKWANKSVVWC